MRFLKLSEKQRIIKNLVAYCVAFILVSASLNDISSIASVLNQDDGLGTSSQAVINAFHLISSFLVPQVLVRLIGFKFTLFVAEIFSLVYFASNAWPEWYTLIPTSAVFGISQSIYWILLGMYFTALSKKYAKLTNTSFLHTQTKLFGWFGCIYYLNYVIGAIWIGAILQLKELSVNSTFNYAENCGANNYPQTKLPEGTSKPTKKSIYILCATIVGACLLAMVITVLFLDDVKDEDFEDDDQQSSATKKESKFARIRREIVTECKNVVGLVKLVDLWLLVPLTISLGFELSIIFYDYDRGFVPCLKNINYIGWCSIIFGVTASISSYVVGHLVKYVGLQSTFILMLMVEVAHGIFMLSWTPSYDQSYVIYMMAVAFGFTNGVNESQMSAAYGLFFPKNPSAYSAVGLFVSVGLLAGAILSTYNIQSRVKIYIYIFIAVLSLVCYVVLEVKTKLRNGPHESEISYAPPSPTINDDVDGSNDDGSSSDQNQIDKDHIQI